MSGSIAEPSRSLLDQRLKLPLFPNRLRAEAL